MQQSLSQYKTFYEVAKAENVSKAARILLISQPAVSKSIKKLESSLGVKLFDRSTIGLNLTKEGKILYDYLDQAFSIINNAELKLKTFSSVHFGKLHIGSTDTLCKHLLMSYINIYTREYPNIRLQITTMHATKAYERLEEKKIDIALVHKRENAYKDIVYIPLMDIHDCFVASKSYLDYFEKAYPGKPDYFSNGNILLLNKKNASRELLDEAFEKNNIVPRQILEINNMGILIDLAKNGVGIAGVVKEFVKQELEEKELFEIPIKFKIAKRNVGFAYNKNNMSKELETFLEIIKVPKKNH